MSEKTKINEREALDGTSFQKNIISEKVEIAMRRNLNFSHVGMRVDSLMHMNVCQSGCLTSKAKPPDSLTAPIHDHFIQLLLTILDIFWTQLPKLKN